MRFNSTLRQHSAIKIFLYNIIYKKSRALHIWSKLLLFLGRRKIQIIFSPQKVFEFFAPNRKKNLATAIIFFWKIIIWFFFSNQPTKFLFCYDDQKGSFCWWYTFLTKHSVQKSGKREKKILCTKQNLALSTIDVNKYRKHVMKIGLKIVFYICLSRCRFLYNIDMFFRTFFIALFL